jgi:two-component system, chemotaxis family, chemotaxis protein CheY
MPKIMVIDDSSTIRTVICGTLQQLGSVETETACDGEDALSKVFAFAPDVILLDWNMPKMNGLEFLKQFRAKNKDTPVVMVTTEAEKPRVVEAIRAGVNDYVVKPFTPDSLLKHVRAAVEKSKAAAA